MTSIWKTYTIEELSTMVTDGAHNSPAAYPNGFPMFSVKDMTESGFDYSNAKTISASDYESLIKSGCQPDKDDILIAKDGSVLKHIFVVKDIPDYVLLSSIAIIRPNKDIVSPDYLAYAIKNPTSKENILNIFIGGSGVPRIILKDFKQIEISLPPLATQKAIAEVLSSLDDKIDLLHRQNKTLEQMAETLFRQWFVEEAKEDWEEVTLDDILSVKGGTTPSTIEPKFWNGNIHWTSPRDITTLNSIFLFDTERKITPEGLNKISSGLLPKGTLLMSSRAPVGVLAFSEVPIAINQGYIAIIDNKGFTKEFIYLWLKQNMDYVISYSNGSTFLEISKTAFKSLKILKPPLLRRDKFQDYVIDLFNKIRLNSIQIKTLETSRDTLLPKLISGEIKLTV